MGNRASNQASNAKHLKYVKEPPNVILVIDDTEIPAHESILIKRSEYFRAIFSSSFMDYHYNKITLKDTNLRAFKSVLMYIYTGGLPIMDRISSARWHALNECGKQYKVDAFMPKKAQKPKKSKKVVNKKVVIGLSEVCIVEGTKISDADSTVENVASCERTNSIIIDLKKEYLLNCFNFCILLDFIDDYLHYTVSMSQDMKDWECVTDYSKYECSGQQLLYFKLRALRYIRIQASDAKNFIITGNFSALYSKSFPIIGPSTNLIVPTKNLVQMKQLSPSDSKANGGLISGEVVENGHVRHLLGYDDISDIVYKFNQPYIIGSLKLLLGKDQSYFVEVAATFPLNEESWTRVFSEEKVSDWRTVTFKKQPVMYIRIVGFTDFSDHFYLYSLKCPVE